MAEEAAVFSGIGASRAAANEASGSARGFAQIALNIPRITANTGGVLGGSGTGSFSVNLDLYDPERPTVDVPLFTPDIDLAELMDLASDNNITYFTEKLADEFTRFMNSWYPDYNVEADALATAITQSISGSGTSIAVPTIASVAAIPVPTLSAPGAIAVPTISGALDVVVPSIIDDVQILAPGIVGGVNIPVPSIIEKLPYALIGVGDILPRDVEDAIWERGRSRLQKDRLAMTETVAAEFSGRGFSLPDGVMTKRLDTASFEAHTTAAELSRDVAIEQAQLRQKLDVRRAELAVDVATSEAQIEANVGIEQAKIDIEVNLQQAGILSNIGMRKAELIANIAMKQAELEVDSGNRFADRSLEVDKSNAVIEADISVKQTGFALDADKTRASITADIGTKQADIDAGIAKAQAEIASQIAIRKAEIDAENLRHAMNLAHQHRRDAINAAVQYVGSIMTTILDKGVEKAKLIVDAKRALWDASNQYYATLIDNGRLMLGYEQLLETRSIEIARLMTNIAQSDTERYTQGAVAGANSMAQIAASAYSSLNTLTTAAHDTIAGE